MMAELLLEEMSVQETLVDREGRPCSDSVQPTGETTNENSLECNCLVYSNDNAR